MLELRRPVADAFAHLFVEKRRPAGARKGFHPGHQSRLRVIAGRQQHKGLALAPAHRHRDDADAVGAKVCGQRAAWHQPAADEIAARRLRAVFVDGAGALSQKVAVLAGEHAVAADLAFGPALAAGGAFAALALGGRSGGCGCGRLRRNHHRAVAELELGTTAAGAGFVAAGL